MIIGIPKETKADEYRVSLLPVGVDELKRAGHQVIVERGAGLGSGIVDTEYQQQGAELCDTAAAIWQRAELIVKVKEPQPDEYSLLRKGQLIFTYFHFAANRALTEAVLASGATALAYETLEDENGQLGLLTPMSEIAGRLSIQEGAKYLERPTAGRGILLAGVPGVEPGQVTILGGGVVGSNAARMAAGLGANVVILDTNVERLRQLEASLPRNVTTLFADRHALKRQLTLADLVIGAVLVRGARAPKLIESSDLKQMKPGSVIVDVAIDQGGSVETSKPTTHKNPTYVIDDVVHYCVTNMPSAVSRTSTYALCNVTLPYVLQLARGGFALAVARNPRLRSAINIHQGAVMEPAVAQAFGLEHKVFSA